MLHDYPDIIEAASEGIRERHRERHNEFSERCAGWQRVADEGMDCCCVAKPLWFDQNGVPRFAPHHPNLCPDIYATEVVLLRIGCQSCDAEFEVQMSWSAGAALMEHAKAMATLEHALGVVPHIVKQRHDTTLSRQIRDGIIHYGDPPRHSHDPDGNCGAGDTMNCDDLKVMEFWTREGTSDWRRVAELEIALPDMQDREQR